MHTKESAPFGGAIELGRPTLRKYDRKDHTFEAVEGLVRLLSNPTMQSNINSLGVEDWKFENEN